MEQEESDEESCGEVFLRPEQAVYTCRHAQQEGQNLKQDILKLKPWTKKYRC